MENLSGTHLANKLMCFGTTLRDTRSYETKCQEKLCNTLKQLGTPANFLTLITTYFYWPDLYALMSRTEPSDPREAQKWRRQNVID